MKKLFALILALTVLLSLAACGGGDSELKEAARELEAITGEPVSVEEVKEALADLEEMTGEKVTVEELIEFTRSMYALANGDWTEGEQEDDGWPFADIPAWPTTEGLQVYDYYEGQKNIFVTGGPEEMDAWLSSLRDVGFGGYFWDNEELEYFSMDYCIRLEDRGTEEGQYQLVISENDMTLGIPEEIADLFPAYNGDGVLLYGGSDEYDGETVYYFNALGETKEGGLRYLDTLKAAGFEDIYDSYYFPPEGYYYKTEGGKTFGYAAEEYWYDFDDETQTGWADFCLTVKPE